MTPGQTGTKCIKVTLTASVPGVVKAYVAHLNATAQGLEDHIMIASQRGTGGSFNSCTGWVADAGSPETYVSLTTAAAVNHDYATGGSACTTTGDTAGESKVWKVSWKFETTGMTQLEIDAVQGATTGVDVVWEFPGHRVNHAPKTSGSALSGWSSSSPRASTSPPSSRCSRVPSCRACCLGRGQLFRAAR